MCVCVSLSQASFFQLRDQRTMHSCKLGHVLFATQGKESVTATRARAERKKEREREREREREESATTDKTVNCGSRCGICSSSSGDGENYYYSLNAKIMARKKLPFIARLNR